VLFLFLIICFVVTGCVPFVIPRRRRRVDVAENSARTAFLFVRHWFLHHR